MPLDLQMSSMLTLQQQELGKLLSQQLTVEWADEILIPVISGAHAVSIRIMDWYVTNYTLAHGTSYRWEDPRSKESRVFSVHLEYGTTLNSKGRLLFDPFRRGPRVLFSGSNGMVHESTLGQLFFWQWVTRYKVLATLTASGNIQRVQAHMAKQQHDARERKRLTGKRKRAALSKKAAHHLVRAEESKRVHMIKWVNCTHRFDDSDNEESSTTYDDEVSDLARASSDSSAESSSGSSGSSSSSQTPKPTSSQSSAIPALSSTSM